ncbi:response regulator receiver protein [Methanolacinia petrolearia DSM 11571]|uniref:Response regulator receiver protein n=1 Tax=Methanolacinia petrolearia (strain DSM 11571 / OCM 486 / SEBR 4847) TaxID=679926 RepID=E1RGY6_METP4|nr:response regulator [Methanolacinia petrolearia]ADN37515.1 response regulator receiver protein [Methanolacinia petrolearia DSM 11571]
MPGSKVLIVEDEVIVAMSIERTLSSFGYDVVGLSTSPEDAIRIAGELKPDLVLMDINLDGEIDGIDAAEKIAQTSDIPVIYLTSYTNEETMRRAIGTNPYGYLTKPVRPKELYTTIETVLNKHRAEIAERELKESKRTQWEILNSLDFGICVASYEPDKERCTIAAINEKACAILGVPGRELWKNKADLDDYIPGLAETVSRSIAEGRRSVVLRSGFAESGASYLLRFIGSGGNYSILISFIDNNGSREILDGINKITGHISSILTLCNGKNGVAKEISEHALEIEKIMKNY